MHLQLAILLSSLLLTGNIIFFFDILFESVLFCGGARVFDFACVYRFRGLQGVMAFAVGAEGGGHFCACSDLIDRQQWRVHKENGVPVGDGQRGIKGWHYDRVACQESAAVFFSFHFIFSSQSCPLHPPSALTPNSAPHLNRLRSQTCVVYLFTKKE